MEPLCYIILCVYVFKHTNNVISTEYNPTYVFSFYSCFSSPKTKHFILRKFANIHKKDVCIREGEKEWKTERELSSVFLTNFTARMVYGY